PPMRKYLLALALLAIAIGTVWNRWPSPQPPMTGKATSGVGMEVSEEHRYRVETPSIERSVVSRSSIQFHVVDATGDSLSAVALVGPQGEVIAETNGSGMSVISRGSVGDGARITFLREGFVATHVSLDYADAEQTIVLRAGRRIVVEVLSTDGAPIAGAVVALSAGPLASSLELPKDQLIGSTLEVGRAG